MGNCPSIFSVFSSSSRSGNHPDAVTIHSTRLSLEKVIGEGGYGFVYLARDASLAHRTCAVKRFLITDAESKRRAEQEALIHQKVSPHENIVTYLDHEVKLPLKTSATTQPRAEGQLSGGDGPTSELYLMMELGSGTLRDKVEHSMKTVGSGQPLFEKQFICEVMSSLIHALSHLHSQDPPVAHWDIKLENVLLVGSSMKLCDFGSASQKSITCANGQQVNTASAFLDETMTMLYRSPESLDLWSKQTVDTQADIWALGVILFTMLCGRMPFEAQPRAIQENAYGTIPNELKASAELNPLLKFLLEGLLVVDPAQRWNIKRCSEELSRLFPSHRPVPAEFELRQMKNMFE